MSAKPADLLEDNERFLPWGLAALGAFTRYYRLSQPPGVVFGACAEWFGRSRVMPER